MYVCLFSVRLRISQRRKKIAAWNFACLFDYYPDKLVFSHFGELWLACSHGGGITSGISYIEIAVGQSELGAAPSRKAVWRHLRLASLLTHLFYFWRFNIDTVITSLTVKLWKHINNDEWRLSICTSEIFLLNNWPGRNRSIACRFRLVASRSAYNQSTSHLNDLINQLIN